MTDIGRAGMVMKGDYNSASTYETLDAVSYQNGLYVAKQNVPAGTLPTNTTYWQNAVDNTAIAAEVIAKCSGEIYNGTQNFVDINFPNGSNGAAALLRIYKDTKKIEFYMRDSLIPTDPSGWDHTWVGTLN